MSLQSQLVNPAREARADRLRGASPVRTSASSGADPSAPETFSTALAQSLSSGAAPSPSASLAASTSRVPSAAAVQADALWAQWISAETQAMLASSLGGSPSGGLFGGSASGLSGLLGNSGGSASGLSGLLGDLGGSASGADPAALAGLLSPSGPASPGSAGIGGSAQTLAEILSGYLSGSPGGLGVPFDAAPTPLTSLGQTQQTAAADPAQSPPSGLPDPAATAGYSASGAPAELLGWIDRLAPAFGLTPQLVQSVVTQESGFSPNAVSPAGAVGLMQLMPETAAMLGVRNPYNPLENLVGGMQYLGSLMKRYHGNVPLALAAYNAGPGAVDRYGGVPPYPQTEQYVSDILSRLGGAAP